MAEDKIRQFLDSLAESLARKTFVKATVGNYKGGDRQLQKVLLRPIATARGELLQFTYRYSNRDEAKNLTFPEATSRVSGLIGSGFHSAVLFTTDNDFQLTVFQDGRASLSVSAPTFRSPPDISHDRRKQTVVDAGEEYLRVLGITSAGGKVHAKQQAKFRQINRFVELASGLIREAELGTSFRVVDMGCGKGYLTFALYRHIELTDGISAEVVGVEQRPELVELCNGAAGELGFGGLRFAEGRIGETDSGDPDVLIALHACDTATDEAIFEGMRRGARVIIVAPCCQKELRPQLKFPGGAAALNKYGLLLEQETESVTDGIRAVLLEECGYTVKLIDFVSPEHTPKNTLIAAVRKDKSSSLPAGFPAAEGIMVHFGITSQRLHSLLSSAVPSKQPR